jgi:hypothetical protein
MALDPVEQAAINRINSLFASVGAEAGNAASRLGDVARSASDASGGLGGFVSSLGSAGSGVSGATSRMASSMDSASTGFTQSAGILAGATDNILGKISAALAGGEANMADVGKVGKKGGDLLGGGMTKLAKRFPGYGKVFGAAAKVAGVLGSALGAAGNYTNDLLQNWRGLTRSGISLQGAMENVGIAQGEANLSLTQLGTHLTTNSQAFAVLGGTASSGAEAFLQLQSTLQSVDLGYGKSSRSFRESLESLGITSDESASLISDMLGSQMMAAKFRNMDEKSQAESTADYIMNLDQLSKLTGKSRKQLADEQKQMANDTQFQAAMNGKSAEEMAAMQAAMQRIQEVGGPAAVEAFKARLAGVVPAGKEARMLLATPMGRVVEEMAGEMANATDASGIGKIASGYENALGTAAEQSRDMLLPLAKAGGLVAGEFSSLFGVMNKTVIRNNALIETQVKLTGTVVALDVAMAAMLTTVSGTTRKDPTDPDSEIVSVGSDLTRTVTEVTTSLQEVVNWGQTTIAELAGDYVPGFLRTAMDAWNDVAMGGEKFVNTFTGLEMDLSHVTTAFSKYRNVTSADGPDPQTAQRLAAAQEVGGGDGEQAAILIAQLATAGNQLSGPSNARAESAKATMRRDPTFVKTTSDQLTPKQIKLMNDEYAITELRETALIQLSNTISQLSSEELMNVEQLNKRKQKLMAIEIEAAGRLGVTMTESTSTIAADFQRAVEHFQKIKYKQMTGATDADVAAITQGGPLSHQNIDIAKVLGKTIEDTRAAEELAERKVLVGTRKTDLATAFAESQKISADRIIEAIEMAGKGPPTPRPSNNDIAGNEYAIQEGVG